MASVPRAKNSTRPLPDGWAIARAIFDVFDALVPSFSDTRLAPDLEDLLWSTVNLFHRVKREDQANLTYLQASSLQATILMSNSQILS
ncbi:hypothetical protein ABIB82_006932 [Bradyrhizobium sp. i1.8.4]